MLLLMFDDQFHQHLLLSQRFELYLVSYLTNVIAGNHLIQIRHHPIKESDTPQFQHELIQFRQV